MDQQQPAPTAVPDVRQAGLGQHSAATDGVVSRVVPKRATKPPQVAAFDSAM